MAYGFVWVRAAEAGGEPREKPKIPKRAQRGDAGGKLAAWTGVREEPTSLFPTRRDAALYLAGLSGFWGGIALVLIAAEVTAPTFTFVLLVALLFASTVLIMNATRKLEGRLSGKVVRPWPFGYASLRTQVIATLPSTVMAAAQRLNLNAIVIAAAVYALLVVDFVEMVIWSGKH